MKGMGRKGIGLQELMPIAMTLAIISVAVGIGIQANEQMLDATMPSAVTIRNESHALTNYTAIRLDYPYIESIIQVLNCSLNGVAGDAQTLVTSGNYSTDGVSFFPKYEGGGTTAGMTWNISYMAVNTSTSAGRNIFITKNASAGISQLAQWTPIITLVLAAGIIIGLVGTWFLRREEY